jgi:ribose transport system ATP-binding protein
MLFRRQEPMEQNDRSEILTIHDLTKKYGDSLALDRVEFNLYAGEVHCLVGENGAGKSTLIKILSGAESPDQGKITVFDKQYSRLTPQQSIQAGIATIYQDVELISSLSVADNIYLGHEITGKLGVIDFSSQNRMARELMESMKINLPATALVESLSPAQQQTLQIAKALHRNAKILIMDEPTASLGVEETKVLLQLAKSLASQNRAIIYISHYLREIFEIGDRVTVLKDGRVTGTFSVPNADMAAITRCMIGRERSLFYDRDNVDTGDVVLQVKDLGWHAHFAHVNFELREGEILGFGGVVGSGRSALMNVLFGAARATSGEIILCGRTLKLDSPADAIAQGIAMIPEDRRSLAMFDLRSLLENIAIVDNEANHQLLNHAQETNAVQALVNQLHILTAGIKQRVGSLSGGNQQKTILARWLLSSARVFIFDEPTKGVDIGAKEQIYQLMLELVKSGKSILMVSSDMPELISMSDRIAVMRNGELVSILNATGVTERELLEQFLGIGQT